jgi:hypothetical protein
LASEPFLPKFTIAVLEPAINKLKPIPRPSNKSVYYEYKPKSTLPIRDTNKGDAAVMREGLKLFIQLLKDMALDPTVDKLTDKMAPSGKFGIDEFRDVLGEENMAEFGKKRKAIEEEEEEKGKADVKRREARDGLWLDSLQL